MQTLAELNNQVTTTAPPIHGVVGMTLPKISIDFTSLRKKVNETIAEARKNLEDDDSIKKSLALLRKCEKEVNDNAIKISKQAAEPIDIFRTCVKKELSDLTAAIAELSTQVAEAESKRKAKKLEEVNRLVGKAIDECKLNDKYRSQFVQNEKWLQKSISMLEVDKQVYEQAANLLIAQENEAKAIEEKNARIAERNALIQQLNKEHNLSVTYADAPIDKSVEYVLDLFKKRVEVLKPPQVVASAPQSEPKKTSFASSIGRAIRNEPPKIEEIKQEKQEKTLDILLAEWLIENPNKLESMVRQLISAGEKQDAAMALGIAERAVFHAKNLTKTGV